MFSYLNTLKFVLILIIYFKICIISCRVSNDNSPLIHVLNAKKIINSIVNLSKGYVASASKDGSIQIWNVEGFLVRTLFSSSGSDLISLSFLQSGLLASGTKKGLIEIWNPFDGYFIKSIQVSKYGISSIESLSDGIIAVAASFEIIFLDILNEVILTIWSDIDVDSLVLLENDLLVPVSTFSKNINMWNIKTEEIVNSLNFMNFVMTSKLISKKLLAIGFIDGTIEIWDPYIPTLVKILKGHFSSVRSLAVLQNDFLVSSGRDKMIKLWDINNQFESITLNINILIDFLLITLNGNFLCTSFDKIYIFDYQKLTGKISPILDLGKK
jgi:WD40 repeat protein